MSIVASHAARSIGEGAARLTELITALGRHGEGNRNEAQTRLEIIDEVLYCLGWSKDVMKVEDRLNGGIADYVLGEPSCAIWEAKREGIGFEVPPGSDGLLTDIESLIYVDNELSAAIRQVHSYCTERGVGLAVATNGPQLVAFLSSRTDGIPPLKGKCLVILSLEHLREEFTTVWQTLSKPAVLKKTYLPTFRGDAVRRIPPKLSSFLREYPRWRYPSPLQSNLRTVSDLLIEDVPAANEEEFIKECYCKSGALAQDALLSKQMLQARYAALFSSTTPHPEIADASARGVTGKEVSDDLFSEALHKRPVVLLGDVGVGKTSFLKNLVFVEASEVFKNAIYLYIDLGSNAALTSKLNRYVLDEIGKQLLGQYDVDVTETKFVKGVYASEIARFKTGIYGDLLGSDTEKFNEKLLEMLHEKITDSAEHLRRSIGHLSRARHKQVIVVLDNCDQRDDDTQQEAFIISQEIAVKWEASVFIALRPHTFFRSRRHGALSAYPQRVFTISPPRVDEVIEKRLIFAMNLAEGRISSEKLHGLKIYIPNLVIFLRVLLKSLKENPDLREFITNMTGGNIRSAVDLIKSFIGSPNVDAQKIVEAPSGYVIPLHEFRKHALLGQYSHYDPESSWAMNLFDVVSPRSNAHFLVPLLVAYLNVDGKHRDSNGFVDANSLIAEIQSFGFIADQIEDALRRLTNKKLIETSERVTFEEDEEGLFGEMPDFFRITTIGAYHLVRWMGQFDYLEAMSFDTPIFDESVRESILEDDVNNFDIAVRNRRAQMFRDYLRNCWDDSQISASYFDFEDNLRRGEDSFLRVARAVERNAEGDDTQRGTRKR